MKYYIKMQNIAICDSNGRDNDPRKKLRTKMKKKLISIRATYIFLYSADYGNKL